MKRLFMLMFAAALLSVSARAQTGTLSGRVLSGSPSRPDTINLAHVYVNRVLGNLPRVPLDTISDHVGRFSISNLTSGTYSIWASRPGIGIISDIADVAPNTTTLVTLYLQTSSGIGENSRERMVTLTGYAMPAPNSPMNDQFYYLDANADGDSSRDYLLVFGPPWYTSPDDSATRPLPGRRITVQGAVIGFTQPPLISVNMINDRFWSLPDSGHNGAMGTVHHNMGCWGDGGIDHPVRVELEGYLRRLDPAGRSYYLTAIDDSIELFLDFGDSLYTGIQLALRPQNGDTIHFVGGLVHCPDFSMRAIVYEWNYFGMTSNLLWRVPGDTSRLHETVPVPIDPELPLPASHLIAVNYPNPFNPTTTIRFETPRAGDVLITVHDLLGREVARLHEGFLPAGSYSEVWDAGAFPSGIYLYRVKAGTSSVANRMVLLK